MSRRLVGLFAAALLAGPWGSIIGQEAGTRHRHHSSRTSVWGPKPHASTTVAAMKRAAKRRRNIAKRRGAA